MKKVMILAGGTSTAWHIAEVLKRYYRVSLVICDINPPRLVHTSVLADRFRVLPPIKSEGYYAAVMSSLEEERPDVLIPLIDDDILWFPRDNVDLRMRGIRSSAPEKEVAEAFGNKQNLFATLRKLGIATPKVFPDTAALEPKNTYFVKAAVGCGSRGARRMTGEEIAALPSLEDKIVQALCKPPEITVDVVKNGGSVYTVCRERVEIKLGVSTKCRVYHDPAIQAILERISQSYALPELCCVQFMKDAAGDWLLTDFNLRSGGGSAISAAVGFEAVRFAEALWLGEQPEEAWLRRPDKERYVVRTYQEIVTA